MHFAPENLPASSDITRGTGGVFIRYSRKDYYFAESLTFSLIQRDVAAWLDVKDLQPGVDWEERLQSAIDNASIWCWSPRRTVCALRTLRSNGNEHWTETY